MKQQLPRDGEFLEPFGSEVLKHTIIILQVYLNWPGTLVAESRMRLVWGGGGWGKLQVIVGSRSRLDRGVEATSGSAFGGRRNI